MLVRSSPIQNDRNPFSKVNELRTFGKPQYRDNPEGYTGYHMHYICNPILYHHIRHRLMNPFVRANIFIYVGLEQ